MHSFIRQFKQKQSRLLNGLKRAYHDKHLLVLAIILVVSLIFNFTGIWWGLPDSWHPDESIPLVVGMFQDRTLHPSNYIAPSLHKYALMAVLFPYYLIMSWTGKTDVFSNPFANRDVVIGTYLIARGLSALLGSLTVLAVYYAAETIYGKRTALLSSACAAACMGLVNIWHYATVEPLFIFMLSLSMCFSLKAMKTKKSSYYFLSALAAGLAASTKYSGGAVLIPLFFSLVFSARLSKGFAATCLATLLLFPAGFLIGTPYAIVDYKDIYGWMTYGLAVMDHYFGFTNPDPGYVSQLYNLLDGMGLPLFLLSLLAVLYALISMLQRKEGWKYSVVLLSFILPFTFIVSGWNFAPMRFILPEFPFLMVLSGGFAFKAMTVADKNLKGLSVVFVSLTVIYSFAYTGAAVGMFVNDPRYASSDYLLANAKTGDKVVETYYGPLLPGNLQPVVLFFGEDYQIIERERPEYVVLSSQYYGGYITDKDAYPNWTKFFCDLLLEKTGYKIVRVFGPTFDGNFNPTGHESSGTTLYRRIYASAMLDPRPEFGNPRIVILKRSTQDNSLGLLPAKETNCA